MTQNNDLGNHSSELRRAATVSLILTGGALAALAVAAYLAKQPGSGSMRIPLGGANAESVEAWLRKAADKMQSGSQNLLSDLDQQK